MVWRSFLGQPSKQTKNLSFPDLEKKLEDMRQEARKESAQLTRKVSRVIRKAETQTQIDEIARRNKPRTILVLTRGRNSRTADLLLHTNSNALASFADNMSEAISMIQDHNFDMVYLISPFCSGDSECDGECPPFFSMDLEKDDKLRERFGRFVKADYEVLKTILEDAEFIAVAADETNHDK